MATEGRPPRRRPAKKKRGASSSKPAAKSAAKAGVKQAAKSAAKRVPKPPTSEQEAKLSDDSAAEQAGFTPRTLDRSVIAIPLLRELAEERRTKERVLHQIVIDLNLEFPGGRDRARDRVIRLVSRLPARSDGSKPVMGSTSQYLFASLYGDEIQALVHTDREEGHGRDHRGAIFRVWPDFPVRALIVKSVSTVKADAAHSAFAAFGTDIVWAVVDSGVDGAHVHFKQFRNLQLDESLNHYDFTLDDPLAQPASSKSALTDGAGHGTHVAGIIAGALNGKAGSGIVKAVSRRWSEDGGTESQMESYDAITGMAPRCRIASFKVLDKDGNGRTSAVIQALEKIQEINGYGRRILIHGVNLSVGYDFEPEWFACGQSPLCVEVDRLARSGVVVVVAAGNTGYGVQTTTGRGNVSSGLPLSINDPGNAELAITVGSTHRDMPHTYGVSYFSSKGPTGDGRLKPDLLAPGEKIVSCAAGGFRVEAASQLGKGKFEYLEQSGTSMAAPHVSGVIAAFLSVRREYIGQPDKVKQIFVSAATDLNRDRYFQGNGLVDLMRAIQSV